MSKVITLRHATPKQNLASILNKGIDPAYSQGGKTLGGKPVTWLHQPQDTPAKIAQVAKRHQVSELDVVVLTVQLAEEDAHPTAPAGAWVTNKVIPPSNILRIRIYGCTIKQWQYV